MNKRIHIFIKIYLSHFILKRVMLLCVRDELETGTDCNIDPSSSRDHSSTSSSSWLGLLNCGSLRAQSPLSAAGSHFGILSPTAFCHQWLTGRETFLSPVVNRQRNIFVANNSWAKQHFFHFIYL